jgi:hypothetical protein
LSRCPTGEKHQSSDDECQNTVADGPFFNAIASHRLDDRPILPKESRRFLHVQGVHLDTTRLPSTLVRYLKVECVASRFLVAARQRSLFLHSAPLICVELEQNEFSILIFVRRDCDARKFMRSVANI